MPATHPETTHDRSTPSDAPLPCWGASGWIIVLAAFALGMYALPLKTIGLTAEYLPGDPADNRLNNYILEHGYRYLTGREASFWDAPMFFPTAATTTTSDAHLGMLPAYAALRACGLSPEGAFQGYFLIPFVLNFASAGWAVRRLGFGPTAAAVGAYLFTFALPLSGQLAHVQLFPRFLVPPAVVLSWEFLRAPRAWRAWAVVGCVVGQMYLSVYIGYLLGLVLAAGLVVSAIVFRRQLPWRELVRPGWRAWAARGAPVGVGVLALVPLLAKHTRGVPPPPVEVLLTLAPRPGAWITPPAHAAAFPELADETGLGTWQAGEQQLLPGLLTLAALPVGLAVTVWRGPISGRGAAVTAAAWTTVALALFLTRYGDVWLYEPLTHLPGAGGIRAVGRVVLVLLFPAGVVLGACAEGVATAAGRAGHAATVVVALLAVGAVAADHWLMPTTGPRAQTWGPFRNSKEVAVRRQAAIGEALRRHPAPKLLYVFPSYGAGSVGGAFGVQGEAMRASQDTGIPCVNGWSGYMPNGWGFFPGYRPLFVWLTATGAPPEVVKGLVVVGEPVPDADWRYETAMRASFPPHAAAP
jgi:hypothetical protein